MHRKSRPIRSLLAAALAFAAAPALAQEDVFSQTVFFGDSLSDSGFFRPLLVQQNPQAAVLGRFTTNPGLVWSEYLADAYGTDASPAWGATGMTPQPGTGTNYAVGGARVGEDTVGGLGYTPSLATQLGAYLAATGGQADADALYSVWGGANDLFAVAAAPGQAQQIIGAAVAAQVGIVGTLQGAGARYVLVPTIPDIGLAPDFSGDPATSAQGSALAATYNAALYGALAQNGLSVIPVDTFTFLREVVADPAAYGFTNVTDRACQPPGSSSLVCNPANFISPDAGSAYLFADGVHPTTRAHELVADLAESMIEGPRQVALLPNVAANTGRARADMVSLQTMQAAGEGDGTRWWADARYDYQRYGPDDSADLYDGGGATVSIGVDWTSGGFVYGLFGGAGRQVVDWGLRRGDFRQNDASLGGYVGWSNDAFWVNGQLSYTQLDYDLTRRVRLGPTTRTYESSVDGDNLAAALDAGWSFGDGPLRHGPYVGLLAQRIDVDGFAEDNPTESTSLAYPEQNFDSLRGRAGWQLSYEAGEHFEPYVRLGWEREFEDGAEQAFAQSQSIPGSLPYAVPAAVFDDSYGVLTYGTSARLWGLDLYSGSSLTIGKEDGSDTSLFLTVRGQF